VKQILQSLKTGVAEVADVPCPAVKRGQLLIRSSHTLVSAGTERMLVEFGKAGWIDKARQQPDKVRMVLDKIRTDGLMPTMEAVFNKLDQPLPLGYCNVGTVLEAGGGVDGFSPGDRVVSNGKHAEVVAVPLNLCARVPHSVSDEEAAFAVLGAIALQGIRLVQPTLGETVVVTGLGLIGLVAVQLLRANGCRVLGLDFDAEKLALAKSFGAEVVDLAAGQDPVAAAQAYSRGRGVDAVIITASTKSNEPVHQAALMCRKRGRIVLVGVTGLELSRADFYEKELSFQVSCSYGPGRYDPAYEEGGHDYPVGFVRWTEQRNLEAVLDMMSDGRLDVKPMVSHRFALAQAEEAYALVGGAGPSLGILLQYPTAEQEPMVVLREPTVMLAAAAPAAGASDRAVLGFIGAGNYATAVLIPAFKAAGARLKTVASSGGVSGLHAGRKFGFETTTTDTASVWADRDINAVVVSTRHDSHAGFVLKALAAGKHLFVEKPLCLTLEELAQIDAAQADSAALVMVGFNRRFAPQVQKIHSLLKGVPG
jgi:threonine dehydrogenase-like Zn-dependent dehydrogenase